MIILRTNETQEDIPSGLMLKQVVHIFATNLKDVKCALKFII